MLIAAIVVLVAMVIILTVLLLTKSSKEKEITTSGSKKRSLTFIKDNDTGEIFKVDERTRIVLNNCRVERVIEINMTPNKSLTSDSSKKCIECDIDDLEDLIDKDPEFVKNYIDQYIKLTDQLKIN